MPDQTTDIQFAISEVIEPGEEITLAQLDDRLYSAHPSLADDPRWVGVAVTRMLRDGRLIAPEPDRAYAEDFRIRRPAPTE